MTSLWRIAETEGLDEAVDLGRPAEGRDRGDGGPLTRYTLRITHVYRREGGEWKVVHEHSNWEPADEAN